MKKLEITKDTKDDIYNILESQFIFKLKDKKEQIMILSNYDISDNIIIQYLDYFDKEILLESKNLSFDLLNTLISKKFISNEDLKNLSTTSYSNFPEEFIIQNISYLDLEKLLLSYSIKNDIIPQYLLSIIDNTSDISDSIYRILSNTILERQFIEKHKNKLYFDSLFLNNDMTNFNREDFILLKNSDSVENRNYLNNNLNFSDTHRLIRRCVNLDELTK